jgi:hypothetical protein
MELFITTIKFPEISLATRDAHKLRGYFGDLFRDYSPLLHNHLETGENRYAYPLVQYKVIDNIPYLVGVNEGGELLINLFLKINELRINDVVYPVFHKNIDNIKYDINVTEELFQYKFKTLWMALNQENFRLYNTANGSEKKEMLDNILKGNILSFFTGMGYHIEKRIILTATLMEKETKFKDKNMIAFSGSFVTNVRLPDFIGLGKAVSRGFGVIIKN